MSTIQAKTPAAAARPKVAVAGKLQDGSLLSPVWLLGVALALSLIANIAQYNSAAHMRKTASTHDTLERTKWDSERIALQADVDRLTRQLQLTPTDRARISDEIERTRRDVLVYEEAIYRSEVERARANTLLKQYQDQQQDRLAEAQQKIMNALDQKIASMRQEKSNVLARRSELEEQLLGTKQP